MACAGEPTPPPGPVLERGQQTVPVGDDERDVIVRMPEDPEGAPILFLFHFLGGSPGEILSIFDPDQYVDDGWIVIAPASRQLALTEWSVLEAPADNADVALYDELLARAVNTGGDPDRVFASGFSAGGLFTSYLTMHRADTLVATAPISGGVLSAEYVTPAAQIPVLLAWGGPSDNIFGFDFHAAAQTFSTNLAGDGHPVWTCEHAAGHIVPAATVEQVETFLYAERDGDAGAITGCDRLP
jgi:poly(3-hydroxybutyrate) depolymerase